MGIEGELAVLKAQLTHLHDRQNIVDCIQRECRARDRQDTDQIASCWWDDGVDEHGALVNAMPDYPERANAGHRALFSTTSHNITNSVCELDGDTANVESYVIGALSWLDSDKTTIAFGRYLDRLEKRSGEWRLLVRRCTIEATADCDGSWVHSRQISGFLKPLWSKQDPSYERPYQWKSKDEGIRW